MELRDIVTMLRAHWIGITLLSMVGVLLAGGVSFTAVPEYRAQNTVLVGVVTGDSITEISQGASFASRQVKTYAEVARSPKVLEPVVQELGLTTSARSLRGDVTATVKGDIQIIEITVTRSKAAEAAAVADAVAAELSTAVEELSPSREDGSPSVVIHSISPAVVPSAPVSPDIPRNLALGLVLGVLLGVGWAALRMTLDTRVRTEADVRHIVASPVLGTISFDPRAATRSPTVIAGPLTIRGEEYRQLRTNLQFVDAAHRPRSFVVTSSRGGEGKSVTTINLALTLAESGLSVCLVDADLRRPSVAEYLGIEGSAGLTTVLIGRAELDDVMQPIGSDGLVVLTSGRTPPNPSELLGSEPMIGVIEALEERFDIVLFDCAPLLPVTDAAVLGKLTDGVLLVAGGGIVTRDQLTEATAKLGTIEARTLGVVVNRARRSDGGSRAYGYHPRPVDVDGWSRSTEKAAHVNEPVAAAVPHAHPSQRPGTGPGDTPRQSTPPVGRSVPRIHPPRGSTPRRTKPRLLRDPRSLGRDGLQRTGSAMASASRTEP